MGVGDRHSKRAAAEKAKAQAAPQAAPPAVLPAAPLAAPQAAPLAAPQAAPLTAPQAAYAVDDRELDDAFGAWDDDDAGAHKSALTPSIASSEARTSIGHKAGPPADRATARAASPAASAQGSSPRPGPGDALVDPVAMRDTVVSRSRTLDDPLTTRVLAEISRSEAANDRGRRGPLPQRARTRPEAVKVAPPKILAAAVEAVASARTGEQTPERSADMIAVERQEPPSAHMSDEIIIPRRPLPSGLARDEPFRKK